MRTLYNWTAKRAGGRITVYGFERFEGVAEHSAPSKLVGIDKIVPAGDGTCRAHVKDGEIVKLVNG